jgi:hypothetical protein
VEADVPAVIIFHARRKTKKQIRRLLYKIANAKLDGAL